NLWPNTPDILHEALVKGGRPAFQSRLVMAATLSSLYGIYSGYELCENVPVRAGSEEYLDSEKYQLKPRDWAAPGNLVDHVPRRTGGASPPRSSFWRSSPCRIGIKTRWFTRCTSRRSWTPTATASAISRGSPASSTT